MGPEPARPQGIPWDRRDAGRNTKVMHWGRACGKIRVGPMEMP